MSGENPGVLASGFMEGAKVDDTDKKIADWWRFLESGDPDDSDGLREVARQAINLVEAYRKRINFQIAVECRTKEACFEMIWPVVLGLDEVAECEGTCRAIEIKKKLKQAIHEAEVM